MISFIVGFTIGTFIGITIMSALYLSKKGDN
jgi:hypothetical protein